MKKQFRVYEKEGAVFRGPDIEGFGIVDDVQVPGGGWEPYQGDRRAPCAYGEFLGVREYEVPEKAAKAA